MQRNFEPMREQVEAWQLSELNDVTAKVVIYEAFCGGNWKLRNTLRVAPCMIPILTQNTRNFGQERSGVFPDLSRYPHFGFWAVLIPGWNGAIPSENPRAFKVLRGSITNFPSWLM